ncbi:MAG: iron ABC transporter permease [Chromatiaceae bacterium]|nr:MAG: iron ABC transporter permease [Chromatiaceae bacterium]
MNGADLALRAPARTRLARAPLALLLLSIALGLTALLALSVGAVAITPTQVIGILGHWLGLDRVLPALVPDFEPAQATVLGAIRAPRVVLAIIVGAALAVSGAAMQGLFRNPLADPALLGVAAGAALAAVAVIVLGATLLQGLTSLLGAATLPIAAFGGSLAATLLVHRLATRDGQTPVATLLLAGIAINAIAGAATGVLTFVADDNQLRTLTFWTMGSLGGATWSAVAAAAPLILLAALLIPLHARALNALLLGEAEARHLGFDPQRLKNRLVVLVALAVGAAVALAGIIGFIGLVVPHLLRLTIGPDHRWLLPGAALLGASLLLGADLIARTLVAPAELPIGIVTALLGGPFFLWLLSSRRHGGGF